MNYYHTQHGPFGWLLLAFGLVTGLTAWSQWNAPPIGLLIAILSGVFLLLAASFSRLTVEDLGESLSVRFGPLPLFGTRVRYTTITSVEPGRSAFIDGWGIHYIPGRGWTYNLWGRDCVVVHRGTSILRIGTNDPAGLAGFLRLKAGLPDPQEVVRPS